MAKIIDSSKYSSHFRVIDGGWKRSHNRCCYFINFLNAIYFSELDSEDEDEESGSEDESDYSDLGELGDKVDFEALALAQERVRMRKLQENRGDPPSRYDNVADSSKSKAVHR